MYEDCLIEELQQSQQQHDEGPGQQSGDDGLRALGFSVPD